MAARQTRITAAAGAEEDPHHADMAAAVVAEAEAVVMDAEAGVTAHADAAVGAAPGAGVVPALGRVDTAAPDPDRTTTPGPGRAPRLLAEARASPSRRLGPARGAELPPPTGGPSPGRDPGAADPSLLKTTKPRPELRRRKA